MSWRSGAVVARSPETVNPKMATGEIEVQCESLTILNEAKTPPFPIQDQLDVEESVRLKYRYIDLRRPEMQRTLMIRHRAMQAVRSFLDRKGFVEVETPMLTRSTPEGCQGLSGSQPGAARLLLRPAPIAADF